MPLSDETLQKLTETLGEDGADLLKSVLTENESSKLRVDQAETSSQNAATELEKIRAAAGEWEQKATDATKGTDEQVAKLSAQHDAMKAQLEAAQASLTAEKVRNKLMGELVDLPDDRRAVIISQMDVGKVSINERGELVGAKTQLDKLKSAPTTAFLFEEVKKPSGFGGGRQGGDPPPTPPKGPKSEPEALADFGTAIATVALGARGGDVTVR